VFNVLRFNNPNAFFSPFSLQTQTFSSHHPSLLSLNFHGRSVSLSLSLFFILSLFFLLLRFSLFILPPFSFSASTFSFCFFLVPGSFFFPCFPADYEFSCDFCGILRCLRRSCGRFQRDQVVASDFSACGWGRKPMFGRRLLWYSSPLSVSL